MSKEDAPTDAIVDEAYITMAQIICDYGDKYLPIFKRLHEIREQRKAQQNLRNTALQVAQNNAP